jgi:cytochrome b involved in lipid metabolism
MSDLPTFTAAEVAAHETKDDLWVTIQGKGNHRLDISNMCTQAKADQSTMLLST